MFDQDASVIVIGGGFAGLALAAGLSRQGHTALVLEALPGPIPALRGELLHPPGVAALSALGLESAVRAAGADEVVGFAAFERDRAAPLPLDYPTGVGLGLEHGRLVDALFSRVTALPGVRVIRGARIARVLSEDGRAVGVALEGGASFRAPLLVAADGRHSRMRKALGIEASATLLSYTVGLVLPAPVTLPMPGRGHVFTGGPGPVLAYPFGDGRVRMNVDVSLDAPRGTAALREHLRLRYLHVVPEPLRTAMRQALDSGELQICANHAITTEVCAVPGAALVGDAGGCSHPLTATGMTCALHDVVTLLEAIAGHGVSDGALVAYQRQRYRYVRARELFAQALYDVLRGATPGARRMREGVFRYWRSPRAQRASMSILMGEQSDAMRFAAEYGRVIARAGRGVVADALDARSLTVARDELSGIYGEVRACATLGLDKALSTFAAEQSRGLRAPGASGVSGPLRRAAARWLRVPTFRPAPSPAGESRRAG